MRELRRKVLVPVFTLTEICDEADLRAIERSIKKWKGRAALTYHFRSVINPVEGTGFNYNLLPVVLDRNSVPWDLGMLFILSRLEHETHPDMTSIHSLADGLGAFREWLDDQKDGDDLLLKFPKMKQQRPTYRYNGFLRRKIYAGEISPTTGNRHMGTVVAFYRWMMDEKLFEPENEPWQERSYRLALKNAKGFSVTKRVASTDVRIATPKTDDPFDGFIQDGGKLRPLPENEQRWVMEAADALGNPEMYLFLLFMILTGARIQTVGTLRVRHFTQDKVAFSRALSGDGEVFKLKIGPGTGIDTKNDKNMVLQVPRSLYETLRAYALSARATRRRTVAPGGECVDQYLFLTQQGGPYYTAKAEARRFDPDLKRRHQKSGGTVRQFIKDFLIPYVRKHHAQKFHFRIHDLRASYGMNQTDIQMALVQKGILTLRKARTNVMALMGHASSDTTDRYLDYRKQMDAAYAAINGYGDQVRAWIDGAMKGMSSE